jgi:hypothetical protein
MRPPARRPVAVKTQGGGIEVLLDEDEDPLA